MKIKKIILTIFLLPFGLNSYSQINLANPCSGCVTGFYWQDFDGDHFGNYDTIDVFIVGEEPSDYISYHNGDPRDCNDNDSSLNPNTTWYADLDQDGLGDPSNIIHSCTKPNNYIRDNSDNCPTSNLDLTPSECATVNNENYIHNRTFRNPVSDLSVPVLQTDYSESITYYDGLGRQKQSIAIRAGGNAEDIINPFAYDDFGNQPKEYLPYAAAASQGGILYSDPINDCNAFYNTSKYEFTNFPFSEKRFEKSNQYKVLEQAAPGNSWSLGPELNMELDTDHTRKFGYLTNSFEEVKKYSVVFENNNKEQHHLDLEGFYQPDQLYKTTVKDENWSPGDGLNKTSQEFKDKEGRLILKRTFNETISRNDAHNTYYVYDAYGNLSYVIPPAASDAIDLSYQSTAISSRNYPWTKLAVVNQQLAQEYDKLFEQYKNELILDNDLYQEFQGQGGFTLARNTNNQLVLTINYSSVNPMEFRIGEIVSLSELGEFNDAELGRISDTNYQYTFLIRNNALVIEGAGLISTLNLTLDGETKLSYNTNYPWSELTDIKPDEKGKYNNIYDQMNNAAVLTTSIENVYGATGGINISISENDEISLNLNIISNIPISLKNGLLIPLKTDRRLSNVDIGEVVGEGYKYFFSIKENSLLIEGEGDFTSIIYARGNVPPVSVTNLIPKQVVEGLCYEYHYDLRQRLIEKKIPGKGWEYMVYDKLDRLVLTQDPNLRSQSKWLFNKYDVFNRIVYSGEFKNITLNHGRDSEVRIELQERYNSNTILLNESRLIPPNGFNNDGIIINYTQQVFPNSLEQGFKIFTVNYYDDYNFQPLGQQIAIPGNTYSPPITQNLKGLATGSLIRVLDTNDWIINLLAYDEKGRVITSNSKNSFLGSQDEVQMNIDFTDKILNTKSTHIKNGNNLIITDNFFYDDSDRLVKHTQTVGNNPEELIVYNQYDELGKLIHKKVGGIAANATDGFKTALSLQTIDYYYNIRGWLKQINDPSDNGRLFSFKLNYDTPELGTKALYNGNISEALWKTKDNVLRSYGYKYDDLNQLKDAKYNGGILQNGDYEDYSEGKITYDKNGNMITLERNGLKNDGRIDIIDQLSYFYFPKSNKLKRVTDPNDAAGFSDAGNGTTNDYKYDYNGNLTFDLNKKITSIEYNHLNLPTKIVFDFQDPATSTHPNAIEYVYDATGVKLAKTVITTPEIIPGSTWGATSTTKTEYATNKVYENNTLQFISQPEGYIGYSGTTFSYVYQFKDHLGNIRVSYTDADLNGVITAAPNEIIEENNYYPFGLIQKGYTISSSLGNPVAQKIKFGGKELDESMSLNTYDFGARNYDPAIGRWMNIDPLAESSRRFSTFVYALNNPIYYIDPDGMSASPPDDHFDTAGKFLYTDMRPTNNIVIDEKVINYSRMTTEIKETQLKDYTFTEMNYFALSNISNHYASQAGVDLENVHNGKISVSDEIIIETKGNDRFGQMPKFNDGVYKADDVYGGRPLMNTESNTLTVNLREGKVDPILNDKNNYIATLDHEGGPIGHMVNPQKAHSNIYRDEINKYKGSVTSEFLQHLNNNLRIYKQRGQ